MSTLSLIRSVRASNLLRKEIMLSCARISRLAFFYVNLLCSCDMILVISFLLFNSVFKKGYFVFKFVNKISIIVILLIRYVIFQLRVFFFCYCFFIQKNFIVEVGRLIHWATRPQNFIVIMQIIFSTKGSKHLFTFFSTVRCTSFIDRLYRLLAGALLTSLPSDPPTRRIVSKI